MLSGFGAGYLAMFLVSFELATTKRHELIEHHRWGQRLSETSAAEILGGEQDN